MKDIGKIMCHTGKGNFSTLMVMSLKGIGKMIKSKGMAYRLMQTAGNTKEIGITITNMDKEKKLWKVAQFTKVNI